MHNPKYGKLARERQITIDTNEQFMVQFFTAGLKRESLHRLQTTTFASLDAAARAAYQVEEYLSAVHQYQAHHLKVNAVRTQSPARDLSEMERRSRSKSRDRANAQSQGNAQLECYNCQGKGHFARDCPRGGRSRSASRSREAKRPMDGEVMRTLTQIAQRLENLDIGRRKKNQGYKKIRNGSKPQGRGRSPGKRQRSNSHSRSSSKGSYYRSRSNSRNRSKN